MAEAIALEKIKDEILLSINQISGIVLKKIILFGSRAKGTYNSESDWDFLVVLENQMTRETKSEIAHKIRTSLAEFYIPCDVIVKSVAEVEKRKNIIGSVIKSAIEEGIQI